jgi:SecD/SecF fusion protein
MAIDANIIIFERLKEEIRWGKTLIAALDAAFARAWVAILDGHVTVILGSMVLFFYGTGPVKGFAVALFLGSIFALYSGVFVTRNLLELFVRQFKDVHLYAPHTGELEVPAERLRNRHYIHFVEKTGIWLAISFIWLAVGIGFMFQNNTKYGHPFNLGIDFTGGDSIILRFKDELPKEGSAFTKIVEKYSEGEPTVQVDAVDPHLVSIRMRFAHSETEAGAAKSAEAFVELKKELGDAFGGYQPEGDAANPSVLEYNHIGPTVGAELIRNAITALFLGLVLIFFYVLLRFNAWQFSLAAVVNIVQDMLLLLAATAILGLEINSSFIAVVLTIAGYSINDTIIIFDRIRENKRHFPPSTDQAQLCNLSLTQTLGRSIYTVLTVIFMTVTLLVFGGAALHDFMLAMLAGLILGGFSSIRFATPLYLFLNKISGAGSGTVTLAPAGGPSLDAATVAKTDDVVKKVVEREVERRKEKSQSKQQRRR